MESLIFITIALRRRFRFGPTGVRHKDMAFSGASLRPCSFVFFCVLWLNVFAMESLVWVARGTWNSNCSTHSSVQRWARKSLKNHSIFILMCRLPKCREKQGKDFPEFLEVMTKLIATGSITAISVKMAEERDRGGADWLCGSWKKKK